MSELKDWKKTELDETRHVVFLWICAMASRMFLDGQTTEQPHVPSLASLLPDILLQVGLVDVASLYPP